MEIAGITVEQWIDNPIFRREIRVLTRGWTPLAVFLAGPIILAGVFFSYFFTLYLRHKFDPNFAVDGRGIFTLLSLVLFWAMMLSVPALAGSSINKDRQTVTLSALRLSGLSPWEILYGKTGAFAVFYSLLYLISVPITALS